MPLNKQQKKFLKKKEREKKVKVKLAARREAIRKFAKEKADEEARMEAEYRLRNGLPEKPEPILNDPAAIARREERKKEKVKERLQKNLDILEALEREYDEDHAGRENLQDNLEAEGHVSVKDKLAAMLAKAKELQNMNAAVKELSAEKDLSAATE